MNHGRVLVVGAYFTDRESRIGHLRDEFLRSERWEVDQRWIALGDRIPARFADVTVSLAARTPKFVLMNRLLARLDLKRYAYVVVCDDDIALPRNFVDDYFALVEECGFALAQPARTHPSYTDHHFVNQLLGIRARQTRFVEIGPLFSVRAEATSLLIPFDEVSPMGWGYDFVWPVSIERAGLRMGIVDACPVAHDLRKPVTTYSAQAATEQERVLLSRRPHLERPEAFHIVKSFP